MASGCNLPQLIEAFEHCKKTPLALYLLIFTTTGKVQN